MPICSDYRALRLGDLDLDLDWEPPPEDPIEFYLLRAEFSLTNGSPPGTGFNATYLLSNGL